jgi:hypothetical protein
VDLLLEVKNKVELPSFVALLSLAGVACKSDSTAAFG